MSSYVRVARYLYRRDGILQFRRTIPLAVRRALNLKRTTITRSLRTGDRREAEPRLREEIRNFDAWVASALQPKVRHRQRRRDAVAGQPHGAELNKQDLIEFAGAWMEDYLQRRLPKLSDAGFDKRTRALEIPAQLQELEDAYERNTVPMRTEWIAKHLEGLLGDRYGFAFESEPERFEFRQIVLNAQFEAYEREQDRLKRPSFSALRAEAAKPPEADRLDKIQMLTIQQVADKWLNDPVNKKSAETLKQYKPRIKNIVEGFGARKRAASITRDDCRNLIDKVLNQLPARHATLPANLTQSQRIAEGRRRGMQTYSQSTIKLHVDIMKQMFEWAVTEEMIDRNPAKGMTISKAPQRTEKSFSTADLQIIFDQPVFTGCVNDGTAYATPGTKRPKRHRYWIPLMGLYSGMRLGEICQLDASDVEKRSGHWVMHLWADPAADRSLKTEASARMVPVHPELIELGFLEYVKEQQEKGGKLFPDLADGKKDCGKDKMSKWFGRFLESAGLKKPGISFHTLRHTFRDALREAEVPGGVSIALGGWTESGVHAGYGTGYSTNKLAEGMNRVAYPGLDLSKLK